MGKSSISFLSVLLLISVLWKPAYSNDKCSIGCKGSPTTQSFLNGHKYNYGVEGTVTIFLTGASSQETSVKLLGQVSVSSVGNCVHELSVQNLVISGPDGKKHQSPPGIDKPVRFTLQDGRIGAEICAEEGDTRRSLNIKRAVISLLQTEQKPSTQVDIFGTCPTDVSSSQEGSAVLVHRSRDLSRCGHREQGKNDLMTGVFNPDAEIKDSQILQSSMNVETKVNNGVPEKVAATEEYLYRPFSIGENGARARVHTKLTMTGKARAPSQPSHCTESRTIIFENPHGITMNQNNMNAALNAVKETAKTLATSASPKSAGNFAQLVRILRTNSKDDLMKVYSHIKGNNVEKRVFLDGLIRAGTGYSIEVSIQLLKNKELGPIEQKLVYLSLGNAKHVNNEALKAAASMLDMPNLPREIYLGVGALGGVFCREHRCHHVKNDGITALSNKLAAKLQNCKPKTKVDEDTVVAVLKGIRNIQHMEDSMIDKLVHCVNDINVKPRVKAAALEAFQADACTYKLKKTAIDIMKNRQLDSEIRIKAYLAIISCPCAHSATEIKNLLDSEPVHQVGNFISTSLRNIRASSNPDKKLARQHYGLIRTPSKFNNDFRKYSFSEEESFNIDTLGLGGVVEKNVIYSQDSFLPRSVNVNMTCQLFGHSLNVLEVGGRQGNLDRVAEHLFGPKSFLRTEDPKSLYKKFYTDKIAELKEKMDGLSRGRRSIKSEVDSFDKNLKAEATPFNNELDLDLYIKLFGTDAVFLSLGDDKGFDFEKIVDQFIQYVNKGVDQVKHFQQEVRAHILFLDAELAYPTSTGLPLKLDLVGSATGRLEAATNIDIRQCMRSPQDAKIDIKLVPSTDIEVTGALLVDADAIAAGLKVIVNLHSSTGGHVIAKVLENGRGFDLQIGLPIDKQEIVTASNDLVYFYAEKGQMEKQTPIKMDNVVKENTGCFDQAAEFLGLTICGEMTVPFTFSGPEAQASISKYIASYPLTGKTKFRVMLEKQNLRGYHIKGVLRSDANAGRESFELIFDAEGVKNGRTQINGEYVYSASEMGAMLSLNSPLKVISGQASFYRKPNDISVVVKGKYDANEIFGKIGFSVQGGGPRRVFKPIAEYQMPGEKDKHNIPISGQVIEETGNGRTKYTIEGVKITMPSMKDPVCIDGHFASSPDREVDFDATVKDLATIKGSVKKGDVNVEFTNKLNPYVNFKLVGHFEYDSVTRNEIDLIYGGDLRNMKNRVILSQMLKYHEGQDFNVITKNKFEICALPLKIRFDADIDPKKVDIELEGQYMEKKADFDLEARSQIKKPGDYSMKMKAMYDKNGIEVFSKRDIVSDDKSNLENYVEFKNLGRYELSGVLLHKTKPNDMNVGAIGHLKATMGSKTQDIRFDIGVIQTQNLYSSHAKISEAKGDLIDYLLKVTRGANANGQLKLIVKNTIAANGQFKVTDSDGKGNGMVIVDFKQAQRKIKGDFKFMVKAPAYGADVDVFLNYEKDNNDKIHFSTTTRKTEKVFDSKNKFEYSGKKFELLLHQDGEYAVAGKMHSVIELVLPTDRCLTMKLDRDVTQANDLYNGQAEFLLSDAAKRGGPASTISYKGKATNSNFEKNIINYEGQVEFKLKDGKHLLNAFTLKNVPEGEKFKFDLKSDVTGNVLPKPMSVVANAVYSDSVTLIDDTYRVKANYGDDMNFELAGVWEVKVLEGDKKYLDDYTLTMRLPFEKAHDIKWKSTVLYVQPENKGVAEFTIVESVQVNADLYKIDANGKVSPQTGFSTVKLLVPHVDPVVMDVNYKIDRNGDSSNNHVELKAKYGKGKSSVISMDAAIAPRDNTFSIKANSPSAENMKKLEFTVHSKNPAPDTYVSNMMVDADGRVYKTESTFIFSKAQPLIDVKYTSPSSPKPSRLYVKGTSLSSTQGKVELKIENIRDITFDSVTEGSVQKDNVAFKMVANCDKLGFKNYQVEIASKDAGNGKRLEFKATNDNKNVLSGSTSYISKQEGPKMIIEGSGAVKVKDDQKSANFKYIRTILGEGNEKGVETFFNMAIGERSYVAESRVTNLEYKNSYVYCEEKKQCAHAELNSKIDMSKPGIITNVVNAGFDLRKLGITPEFGLMIKDEVSDKKPPQYTLDLHVNKEDKKYHLHVYNTPEYGNAKSGVTIQLPQRVMALESVVSYPTDKGLPFPVRGEVCLDLDKNKQGHRTSARFLVDMNVANDKQQTAVAEFGFNHPKMNKEAVVKIRGALVRPQQNSVKIETSASISHPVLGADRETKVLVEGSPTHFKFLVNTPLVKVIDVEGSATINDNLQKGEMKFCLLEGKPVRVVALAKDYQYFEFTTGYSDESDRKLSIVGHIQPEKRVDVSADILLGGEKKNMLHGALFLEDNLIKSDYGMSKDNLNYFLNALKKDLDNLEARIKQLGEKANNDMKAVLQRVEPTFKQIEKAYSEDLAKFYKEIADDKALKEISHAFNVIVQYVAKMLDEVLQATKPMVDNITNTYIETAKKIQAMYEKQIEPAVKQLYDMVAQYFKGYMDSIIEIVAHFAAIVTDFYEKHKPELEELTNTLTAIFKDLTRLLVAQLKEFRNRVVALTSELSKTIKDMPIFALLKEKYEELAVPEQAIAYLQDAYNTLRPLMPSSEIRDFTDALNSYIVKKLKQEKCDDNKELRMVYQKLVTAVTSTFQFIITQLGQFRAPAGPASFNPMSFLPGAGQSPPSLTPPSVSLINQILTGDIPDLLALIRTYRPKSINPFDEVPGKLRAVIVNGQHIFTFDGRHMTFPGNCRYVLTHDHVDRNFTLLMQLANGQPKALVLEDKSGTIIELKDNGQVTLNGANHGYPVVEKDSFAFRQANGRVGLGTLYGLVAFCTTKLEVCYVEVNGFYLGKLRGLLGDGNNEPYDDFRLPNGKICESESEFGNAYRLARSCPQVKAPEHSHHQLHHMPMPPACEQVFGGSSPLRPLNLFLDIAPFRQACIHACSGNSAEAVHQACDLARGYAALALTGMLPAVLPDVCVQCRDADKPRSIGESFEIKVPNKQADIVIAFETTADNEKNYKNIVVPLVGQVIDGLKNKHITDVKVYLVGITPKFPYPIIYDTDNKLKNAKVQFDDKSRYQRHPELSDNKDDRLNSAYEYIASIVDAIRIEFGITNIVAGYQSIFDLPLRAGAIKHTISVVGEECTSQCFLVEAARSVVYSAVFENMAYTHSIVAVTPAGSLAVGSGKNPAQIVGYTEHSVIMLGDKKGGKDTGNLRSTLEKSPDACRDFVESTDGIVFSATNFHAMNGGQQKQFIQTAAAAINHRLLHETAIQECTCMYADPFRVRSVCVSKDKKEVTGRRK